MTDYSLFDKMIEGVQVINLNWQYVYVNDSLATQGKRSRDSLIGRTMMECYPGIEHTQVYMYIAKCMQAGMAYQVLNEFRFPDGEKGWFELRMHPVGDGVLIMSYDVTHQIRLENELRKLNQTLERTLQERVSELLDCHDKGKELNEFRSSFLSEAQLNLINPLQLIISSATELENHHGNNENIKNIITSAGQIIETLNKFLSMYRIKDDKLN